jgi:hypothetical protein
MIEATREWIGLIEATTFGVSAQAGDDRRTVDSRRRAGVDFIGFSELAVQSSTCIGEFAPPMLRDIAV